ncbi:MAG: hypothetical protein A2V99_07610 [Spirochaetes bacterium RBG_16_67_19]|nr:MAG: hypothetical protein A2V99_07610 [Spirochaetes bacterium RBG_16_67_19]
MKKTTILIGLLLAAMSAAAFGESFRLGTSVGAELLDRPTFESIQQEFDEGTNLLSGLYWEVLRDHLGFGMTYLVDFQRLDSPYPEMEYLWFVDWVGSFDLRYHFFEDFFLDPFLEAGLGSAGRVDISSYQENGLPGVEDPLELSLFGQVGGGLAFRLSGLHLGARLLYRVFNNVPPATEFQPYPLKGFRFDLFGGFSL